MTGQWALEHLFITYNMNHKWCLRDGEDLLLIAEQQVLGVVDATASFCLLSVVDVMVVTAVRPDDKFL